MAAPSHLDINAYYMSQFKPHSVTFGGKTFTKSNLPKHMLKLLGPKLGATVLDTWVR